MFRREQLYALYAEFRRESGDDPEYELLLRDAHLGIALHDAGRPLGADIDARVAALIERHAPKE